MAQIDDSRDSRARLGWRTNSKVEIYSNSRNRWFTGQVVRVFTDDEGEWLEIRYDNTMSKQVQRYSSDIRPVQVNEEDEEDTTDNNPPQPATPGNLPFTGEEMKIRQEWKQDEPVQIYSNTNKEWYDGKIVDIVRDEEGEWLNVIWERVDGEAMSKQVQRFSTDIRPSPAIKAKRQAAAAKRKAANNSKVNNGTRRAPRFSRSIPSSTHTYPATSQYRRIQKLSAIVEEDRASASTLMQAWGSPEVADWLTTLGRSYARYTDKFAGWDGTKLSRTTEDQLAAMTIPKLHRCKILLEISRYCNPDHSKLLEQTQGVDVLGWDPDEVCAWVQSQPMPLSKYANIFKDNGVDGILLFEIDEQDLKDMEMSRRDRAKILEMIQEYAQTVFPDEDEDDEDDDLLGENGNGVEPATVPNGVANGNDESAHRGHRRRGSVQMLPVASARTDDAVVELLVGVTEVLAKVASFGAGLQPAVEELQRKAEALALEKHDDPKVADCTMEVVKVLSVVCSSLNVQPEVASLQRLALSLGQSNDVISSKRAGDQNNGHKRRQSLPLLSNMPMIDEENDDDSDDLSDID